MSVWLDDLGNSEERQLPQCDEDVRREQEKHDNEKLEV